MKKSIISPSSEFLSLVFITLITLISCTDKKKPDNGNENKVTQLFTEVMSLHDVSMKKSEQSLKLVNKLKKQLSDMDTLKNGDSSANTSPKKIYVEKLIKKLDSANENMMDWMADFNPDIDNKPRDETVKYLSHNKKSIIKIDSVLDKNIELANKYLNENK